MKSGPRPPRPLVDAPWPKDGVLEPKWTGRRFRGTEINGAVYQVGHSRHSDCEKFRKGYDQVEWDRNR